jgi:hypothetical protein
MFQYQQHEIAMLYLVRLKAEVCGKGQRLRKAARDGAKEDTGRMCPELWHGF